MAPYFGARASAPPRQAVGEVCFNTSMTGYQEIITDPSYAGQIITFTFPHIGNVGTNLEDIESINPAARGVVLRGDITEPANWRNAKPLDDWLKGHNLPGICGVDTRAHHARASATAGRPTASSSMRRTASSTSPLRQIGAATGPASTAWTSPSRSRPSRATSGTRRRGRWARATASSTSRKYHVVAVDYGAKRNILRCLANAGCKVTVVPATATAEDILRHKPDGVFLSNGPGDPAATAATRAGDPGRARQQGADLRHLPRPSDPGADPGRQDARRWSSAIAAPTSRSRT